MAVLVAPHCFWKKSNLLTLPLVLSTACLPSSDGDHSVSPYCIPSPKFDCKDPGCNDVFLVHPYPSPWTKGYDTNSGTTISFLSDLSCCCSWLFFEEEGVKTAQLIRLRSPCRDTSATFSSELNNTVATSEGRLLKSCPLQRCRPHGTPIAMCSPWVKLIHHYRLDVLLSPDIYVQARIL
jgi:hypothetical protein